MSETMRALVIDEPGSAASLELRQLPIPQPGQGEVLVKVAYAAVKPIDTFARNGTLDFLSVPWPLTPGMEFSGVIESVGPGVSASNVGRRVINIARFGGWADYAVASIDALLPLPDGLDLKTGAVIFAPIHTAYQFLKYAGRLQGGETVVVHSAAGAIGLVLTQMALERDARVIGLAGGSAKLKFAQPYGASVLIDYIDEGWPARVKEATDGRGADLIIDLNAGPQTTCNFDALAPNGRLYVIGATAGSAPKTISFDTLFTKNVAIGTFAAFPPSADDLSEMLKGAQSGRWSVPVTDEAPLDQGPSLVERFDSRQTTGRVVINVAGEGA